MIRRVLIAVVMLVAAAPSFAGSFSDPMAGSFQPRVPVSVFARPLAWFDSSRLHMTNTISVGSGFAGGTSALQTTQFSYAFRAPLTMSVSVGNTLGTGRAFSNGASLFLQAFDLDYRPTANSTIRVQFQNVRSPLQYGQGFGDNAQRSFWGY